MKFAILLCLAATGSILAQDAALKASATVETSPAQKRKLEAQERARRVLEEKPFTYGGFLTEFSRAGEKKKFLSLRQPRDPKTDYKYLYVDERTARPKGFVLFSIDFRASR
jgi:hypothetical protein